MTLRCRGKDAIDKTYYKDGKLLEAAPDSDSVTLYSVSRDNSAYHCTANWKFLGISTKRTSLSLRIQVQGDDDATPAGNGAWPGSEAGDGAGCSSAGRLGSPSRPGPCAPRAGAETRGWLPHSSEPHPRNCACFSPELFPRPALTVSPSQPTEGDPVTLTCDTRLPPERSRTPLRFCFFREDRALGQGWSGSPELQVPAVWGEDAGSYWCQARTETHSVVKTSLRVPVRVRSEYRRCACAVSVGSARAQ